MTTILTTIAAAFLASLVEVVEAFTIVLAVGITQSWRPALLGTGAGLLVLAILVLIFGPLLTLVPLGVLQFVIGVLLILFGMRWLRKAILRASGVLVQRDETRNFELETAELARTRADARADWIAGLAAFKAVLLEGTEVVFIVIAVGAGRGLLVYASLGALAAFVLVMIVGVAVHRPLSQVPENALKFIVGLMLTTFGIFWTGEGLGADWPGADLSLFAIFAAVALVAWALTRRYSVPVAEAAK